VELSFDFIFIIFLSTAAYLYCRLKIKEFLDYTKWFFLFGFGMLLFAGLISMIAYGQHELSEIAFLKKNLFIKRFFLISYCFFLGGIIGYAEKMAISGFPKL